MSNTPRYDELHKEATAKPLSFHAVKVWEALDITERELAAAQINLRAQEGLTRIAEKERELTIGSTTIPTWRERYKAYPHRCPDIHFAMEEEIGDLRAALVTIENATIERCAKVVQTWIDATDPNQFEDVYRSLQEVRNEIEALKKEG